jgi:KCNQ voltage-gated potassium channel
MIIAIKT